MVQSGALVPTRNLSTLLYVAERQCRDIADSWIALAIVLKLFFRFGGFWNLASVI